MSPQKHDEVQQDHVQGIAPMLGKPPISIRLREGCLDSSPAKSNLGILVDEKLNMSLQLAQAAQEAKSIHEWINREVPSRTREVIVSPNWSTVSRSATPDIHFNCGSSEVLEQATQRICGCPISGDIQD